MKQTNLLGGELLIPYSRHWDRVYRYTNKIKENLFVIHIIGKIRRFCLLLFRKNYIRSQQKLRRGECRQCARCCSLAFRCPLLTRENLCLTYMKGRPDVCKLFPIDQRDIEDVTVSGGQCGYWFGDNECKNV